MYFNHIEKFIENKPSSISNYDLLALENKYYKKYAEVGESIHLIDSCLYEINLLSYVNKDVFKSLEDLAIPNSTALATTDEKGKLAQIWKKVIEFLKKMWNQLSELFIKAKEFIFEKSKLLINKIDNLIKSIQAANKDAKTKNNKFTIEIPNVEFSIKKSGTVFDDLLKLDTIITDKMNLEQIKSAEYKIQNIDKSLDTLETALEITKKHPRKIILDKNSLLSIANTIKNTLKENYQYVEGYNKNIESAKIVIKKMHPDRFVGQDQTIPTAITSIASLTSSMYKSAIKYIKNITDITESFIVDIEKQTEYNLN